jgi:hypothetical protein
MAESEFAPALKRAREKLALKKAERFRLATEIDHLERVVEALSAVVEMPTVTPDMGLTEGIKAVLQLCGENRGLYPTTIRLRLEEAGFVFKGANPMASIHAVLKRLEMRLLIHRDLIDGKSAFFWNGEMLSRATRDALIKQLAAAPELDIDDETGFPREGNQPPEKEER